MKDLKQIEDTLPSKLSELIRLAIKDLNKVEKMPDYAIDMGTWHDTKLWSQGLCHVCFAGSVMTCELKVEHGRMITPSYFNQSLHYKFEALDKIRKYDILDSLCWVHIIGHAGKKQEYRDIDKKIIKGLCKLRKLPVSNSYMLPSYSENPKQFKLNMLYIAKELKKLNL